MPWLRALIVVLSLTAGALAFTPQVEAGPRKEARASKQEARYRKRETRRLVELTEAYWRAVRWGDRALMGLSIQDPGRRALFMTETTTTSYRAAEVVQVLVDGPISVDEYDEPILVAFVIIRVEAWGADQLVVEQQVLYQRWIRDRSGWWVAPGDELGHPYENVDL
ncbi:MAG: hypothetical protein IPN01_00225 [Deltaproteobacteria bacterium]|nr:hypothetical protein [Deltaproteobacteria bacterium]